MLIYLYIITRMLLCLTTSLEAPFLQVSQWIRYLNRDNELGNHHPPPHHHQHPHHYYNRFIREICYYHDRGESGSHQVLILCFSGILEREMTRRTKEYGRLPKVCMNA